MLKYLTVPVTAFAQNCSIVWCDETKAAAVIDAGGEVARLRAEVKRLGLDLQALWLTHAHIDHAGGAGQWAREDGLPIIGPHPEQYTWWSNRGQARAKNVGWRLDYHLATPGIAAKAKREHIYLEQRFSDHAPLTIDYDFTL